MLLQCWLLSASFRHFSRGGGGGKMMIYGIKRRMKLSLIPSPSLNVHMHRGKRGRKKALVSTVCAYAGFHEAVNYTGHSRIFSS